MYEIKRTNIFNKWLSKLKDTKGKVSIFRRISRMKKGNFGDCKPVGNNIYELRVHVGAGYRVYYTKKENMLILVLIGGDKSTQKDDIKKANNILKEIENE